MARIGIMTFLHNDNYGSTLQAWALQQALIGLGHRPVHIDYTPSQVEKVRNLLLSGNSPALLLDGLRKRAVKAGQTGARSKAASFRGFYAEHMALTAPCRDHAALKKAAPDFDLLAAGSDQVWSPVWLNPAYFLDFAAPGQPRIAYAASLGVKEAPSRRKAAMLRSLTAPFAAASVREQEGAELLRRLTGRDFSVMPDPVVLVPREKWLALAEMPADSQPYLVCYFIGSNPDYWARAAALSKATGLPVRVIPVTDEAYRQPYPMLDGLSPQQWIGALAGAAHILTDSFHGAVFSAILGRPATLLRRYADTDPESKNSRIDNLLRELGCAGQQALTPSAVIDARLAALRQQGLGWLEQAIRQAAR